MTDVFVPKEVTPGENRVAATPISIKRLISSGLTVRVECGAGLCSYISDEAYEAAGAQIVDSPEKQFSECDIVLMVNAPSVQQSQKFKQLSSLVCLIDPDEAADTFQILLEKHVSVLALNFVPRISRAQNVDALSSQSNLAGYKAVLLGANNCPRIFPMMMTAAGTIKPAKVVVLGAGVAGLQAIATAKRLGAVVVVSDPRPAVKEQAESLGAIYIEVPSEENLEDSGGYAKEASPEYLKKQAELTRQHMLEADVIVTTALIRGKPAPKLIDKEVVQGMKAGSVIVDLAAEKGGNCELTRPGEIIDCDGVKIIGSLNLAGMLPVNASEMYARNVLNVVTAQQLENGTFEWRLEDSIVKEALLAHRGLSVRQRIEQEEAAFAADESGDSLESSKISETGNERGMV